ncbi:MAG TPA: universal stress protein [Bryobacteraceae bacterium]|nr:universal stress protein [Bryobacteraceae bacterium]
MNELKLLFATNFSDSCFRAIRAVAQMADAFPLSVTIANVCDSPKSNRRELNSFFAEADHYDSCRRITLTGKPSEAIAAYTREEHFDMIISPGSDRIGIPRPFHQSLRSALLRNGSAPIWTTSRGLEQADFRRPIKTIAVGIDGSDSDLTHLNLAASFAGRIDAKLRLLTVVPPVSEGTLITQAVAPQPLHPSVAIERIEYLLRAWGQVPTVDVALGSPYKELQRMAMRCDADLLFLTEAQSCQGMFFRQISNTVNNSPCAVISIPSSLPARFKWSFQPKRHAHHAVELEPAYA